jgi:microcystin-dependent protein
MSQWYVGEIRLLPYSRGAPIGWQLCNGALLPISQYDVLYTLLGTTYGGDGVSTFGVPDLRGRIPIHQGTGVGLSNYVLGQKSGAEVITLTSAQMPSHPHALLESTLPATSASVTSTASVMAAGITGDPFYAAPAGTPPQNLPLQTVQTDGGSQPHDNCAPTLVLNYCIAYVGIYPSQS